MHADLTVGRASDSADRSPAVAIETRGLTKIYRPRSHSEAAAPRPALDAIDLQVPRGAVFGLLGPNGAGKSTFINILAGLVTKTSGTARIWGIDIDRDPRQARAAIGIVPQELNIDPFFTPWELLDLQAGLFGLAPADRRTDALLAAVGLSAQARVYSRTLSGGMRRRLMVAKAMVHAPPVLVLDEPTAGVDVELRRQLWDHIRALNRAGTTVVLTTHYLEEAQQLCDTIAIINHGVVVACERTAHLLRRIEHKDVTLTLDRDLGANALPAGLESLAVERAGPRHLRWRFQPSRGRVDALLEAVRAAGYGIVDVSTEEADLEDIFLSLTRDTAP